MIETLSIVLSLIWLIVLIHLNFIVVSVENRLLSYWKNTVMGMSVPLMLNDILISRSPSSLF
jgi:hypothetical protein